MFCPKCGTQLPDGSKFCGSCGARLEPTKQATGGDQAVSSATPSGAAHHAAAKTRSSKLPIIGAIVAVLAVGGIAFTMGSGAFGGNRPGSAPAEDSGSLDIDTESDDNKQDEESSDIPAVKNQEPKPAELSDAFQGTVKLDFSYEDTKDNEPFTQTGSLTMTVEGDELSMEYTTSDGDPDFDPYRYHGTIQSVEQTDAAWIYHLDDLYDARRDDRSMFKGQVGDYDDPRAAVIVPKELGKGSDGVAWGYSFFCEDTEEFDYMGLIAALALKKDGTVAGTLGEDWLLGAQNYEFSSVDGSMDPASRDYSPEHFLTTGDEPHTPILDGSWKKQDDGSVSIELDSQGVSAEPDHVSLTLSVMPA